MNWLKRLSLLFLLILSFPIVQAQQDTITDVENSTALFFQRSEKTTIPQKIFLVTRTGKAMTMTAFLKTLVVVDAVTSPSAIDYGFADLDNDGKKELVISNFTGGAHCCDEIYIFRNTGVNKYQHAAKLSAGNTIITDKNEFIYDLSQQFGYFFTCYACGLSDTGDAAPIELRSILLKYNKGKMLVIPAEQELKSIINDNLGKLGEEPYQKLEDDIAQDEGLRKEFAMNLAVFYYYFGKNIVETQKLFNKYYKYPDAKKVWAAFVKQLQYIRKDNDF